MKRLAVISTHPIQYYAPLFRLLAKEINLKVFYTWGEASILKHDPGFGRAIEWDIPLLEGYEYEFLPNTSSQPGSHHFKGIVNPNAIKRIDSFDPDTVMVFGWAYQSHLKIIRYFKNKLPVWFRGDSTLLDEQSGIKAAIKNLFLKWVYVHIDRAFYVGSNNRAYFEKYGLKDKQLIFAPHAIDNARFEENRRGEAAALRNELGIADHELLILFAGKFEKKKNPLLLLEAFKKLDRQDTHLLFVGNGELEEELRAKSKEQGARSASTSYLCGGQALSMTERIHFMDFQNQSRMPVIYQASDLFCLPSQGPGETWGLAVNEAMAAGTAVLVSDKAGCAIDLVKSGENGDIFFSGNMKDLIKRLSALCDKELLSNLSIISQEIIENWNLSLTAIAIISELQK